MWTTPLTIGLVGLVGVVGLVGLSGIVVPVPVVPGSVVGLLVSVSPVVVLPPLSGFTGAVTRPLV